MKISNEDINILKNIITTGIPLAVELILFGSYARGDHNENSDIDFLVLTEREIDRKSKLKAVSKLRGDIADKGYNADVIIKSKDKFIEETKLPIMSRIINEEGKTIWTRI
ncbi:MAG TPA: nucleotidyltransferase domain-containing protein [Spirochaetota bacterium]|nr:nucleotidyltransferase domain-containing protein [Spirochaetota bacterium]HQO41213.1 nucleotidyltransferase domain-containing protein [Spirochaetota bacterium]